MKKIIYAYVAGMLDGEGCITICKRRKFKYSQAYYYDLHVQFHMASSEALQFIHSHFGGYFRKIKKRYPNRRQLYRLDFFSKKALNFLEKVSPYLIIKKEEARTAIEFQSTKKKPHSSKGFTKRSPETAQIEENFYLKLRHLKLPQ